MNPPTTLTNHNPPATIGCGLNPNPIRREESDTPQGSFLRSFTFGHVRQLDKALLPTIGNRHV